MKLSDLTDKQRALFASHIEYAANRLSNDCCDDSIYGSFDEWTELEKKELCSMYNKWNNVDEDDEEQAMTNVCRIRASSILNIAALILSPEKEE